MSRSEQARIIAGPTKETKNAAALWNFREEVRKNRKRNVEIPSAEPQVHCTVEHHKPGEPKIFVDTGYNIPEEFIDAGIYIERKYWDDWRIIPEDTGAVWAVEVADITADDVQHHTILTVEQYLNKS